MTSSDTKSKKNRAVTTVRILAWLAVGLFLVVLPIFPRGITMSWSGYLTLFTPIILVDVAALIAFAYFRSKRFSVSPAYALMSVAVIVGVCYITLFELRLRW